jgi:hypothetical protein
LKFPPDHFLRIEPDIQLLSELLDPRKPVIRTFMCLKRMERDPVRKIKQIPSARPRISFGRA